MVRQTICFHTCRLATGYFQGCIWININSNFEPLMSQNIERQRSQFCLWSAYVHFPPGTFFICRTRCYLVCLVSFSISCKAASKPVISLTASSWGSNLQLLRSESRVSTMPTAPPLIFIGPISSSKGVCWINKSCKKWWGLESSW